MKPLSNTFTLQALKQYITVTYCNGRREELRNGCRHSLIVFAVHLRRGRRRRRRRRRNAAVPAPISELPLTLIERQHGASSDGHHVVAELSAEFVLRGRHRHQLGRQRCANRSRGTKHRQLGPIPDMSHRPAIKAP